MCFFFLKIYLFLAVLGLHCFAWAFSICGEQGLLALHGLSLNVTGGLLFIGV